MEGVDDLISVDFGLGHGHELDNFNFNSHVLVG